MEKTCNLNDLTDTLPTSILKQKVNERVTLYSIKLARTRIKNHAKKTPVLTSSYFNELTGKSIFFKCENFQKTGSFKYRGALNTIKRLKEESKDSDFVAITHSSGNLGQGLALAASQENVKSIVLVPDIASDVKKKSMKEYGAEVRPVTPTPQGAEENVSKLLIELNGKGEFVDDHPFIIEGQGTVALELLEEVPDLDAIISCCGTGGLVSGLAVAAKSINPNIKIITAEPQVANTVQLSLMNKSRTTFDYYPNTIADGLRVSVYKTPWKYIQEYVDSSLTATEKQIKNAMFYLLERMKILAEPSGAVSTAVLFSDEFQAATKGCEKIAIVITGGNMDLSKYLADDFIPS